MDRPPVVRTAEPSDDAGVRRVVVAASGAKEGDARERLLDDLVLSPLAVLPVRQGSGVDPALAELETILGSWDD